MLPLFGATPCTQEEATEEKFIVFFPLPFSPPRTALSPAVAALLALSMHLIVNLRNPQEALGPLKNSDRVRSSDTRLRSQTTLPTPTHAKQVSEGLIRAGVAGQLVLAPPNLTEAWGLNLHLCCTPNQERALQPEATGVRGSSENTSVYAALVTDNSSHKALEHKNEVRLGGGAHS